MNRFLFLLLALMPSAALAQSSLQIEGPDSAIGYNRIAEVTTNITIENDDDGLPSHTIEWSVPREYRSRIKLYDGGSLLAIPTGCRDDDIIVEVRVTNWIQRRIEKTEIEIRIRKDPGSIDPDPEPEPPANDFTKSPLYEVTKLAIDLVTDPDKQKWAAQMTHAFGYIAGEVKDNQFTSVDQMMEEVRKANRGELFGDRWPDESRAKWIGFRQAIATALDELDAAGELQSVDDHWIHWKAIELALKESN